MMPSIAYEKSERIEVYRFNPVVAILVPLFAIVLQSFIPIKIHVFGIFDLPLLITVFFAVARRNQITGLLTGAAIGLLQDALTHQPLGIYGISKTLVAYAASSLGAKIDVENPGTRVLMIFGFYFVHNGIYWLVARWLVRYDLQWVWMHELRGAVANALLAVLLFHVLDRLKQS